jgi:hypothetical protein
MKRPHVAAAVVLTVALAPGSALGAADGWAGARVFPAGDGLSIRGDDGKVLGAWSITDGEVLAEDGEWIKVRHRQAGPHQQGWVRKGEVVKLADAPRFFTDRIRLNEKDVWAYRHRARAWTLKGEHDNAVKDLTEVIRLNPSASHYHTRGLAWHAEGDADRAGKDYDEAIRLGELP